MLSPDRQRGALLGLVVGDALGAAVEFMSPGTFFEVTGYRGGGPHGLAPGEWTDDSSMALALADSIASVGWDLNNQARRYVAWWQKGEYSVNDRCFDIGITTRSALSRFMQTGDARTAGDPSERASGNGSIMRLAPVPIRYAGLFPDDLEELARYLIESSLPTHASPQCVSACAYFGLILCGLIHGIDAANMLDYEVGGCRECLACKKGTVELCSIDDDANALYRRMVAADLVLIAAPIFCWGFPAQIKGLIDRMYCMMDFAVRRPGAPRLHNKPMGRPGIKSCPWRSMPAQGA